MKNIRFLSALILSLFIVVACSTDSTPIYQLTVNVDPAEAGTVSPQSGEYEEGESVEIKATANEHWEFDRWQGDHTGTNNPVTITMSSDMTLSALFSRLYPLTVNTQGEGSVSENVVQQKTNDYSEGTVVELTANPDAGWEFESWEGDITGSENPQTITIDEAKDVTANFIEASYTIQATVEGQGNIIVTPDKAEYSYGEEVSISADPAEGWNFVHWSGDLEGANNPITLTVQSDLSITANFDNSPFAGGNGSCLYPYQINTLEQLEEVRYYASSHFVQISDIDASATANWNNDNGFLPIGDETIKFTGVYDGGNYAISNLNITPQSFRNVNGFFGYIEDALLKNMNMIDINIETCCVGGLVFSGNNSEIRNIHVSGQMNGGNTVGGIMNENRGGSIINSSTNIIFEAGSRIGGLVVSNNGNIENSFTTGKMNPNTTGWGEYAGGIAGFNSGVIKNSYSELEMANDGINNGGLVGSNYGTIEASYFKGNVSGNNKVGGLVSENSGIIIDSYVFGSVVGEGEIGGIAGTNTGEIINSYSICEISGATDVGGIVGVNGATIESSYWDTETTLQNNGVGRGNSDGTTGLTTTGMQGTSAKENMPEFDWVNVWVTTDSYPVLHWQQE